MDLSLDIYTDPGATVLRDALGGTQLPAKLASTSLLSPQDLAALPDRLFALVGTYGGEQLRKFAMHDEAHLGTSILYFLANSEKLPEAAQQKVASNLVNACGWYDTDPPDRLIKIALLGTLNAGLSVMAVPAKLREEHAKSQASMDAFRAAQASGSKVAGTGRLVTSDGGDPKAWEALEREFNGTGSLARRNDEFQGEYPNPFDAKVANTSGTELGSHGAMKADPRGATPASRMAVAAKTSSWQYAGEIPVPGQKPTKLAARHYALPHQQLYPIDTAAQVKQASAYFEENFRDFDVAQKRAFAVTVTQRAADLGVKVAGRITSYSGSDYGSFIAPELEGRIRAFEGTTKTAAYQLLLDRRADIPAPVMVEMLKKADRETGVDAHYGRAVTGFREPLLAVYEKSAADHGAEFGAQFSWTHKGHHVSEDVLNLYSVKSPELDPLLGVGFSLRFQREPVKAFKSLPDDQKVLLSRLANAEASRTP
jgi:hypothetical protein